MTTRKLYVLDIAKKNVLHTVKQIHFDGWEDFEVPQNEGMVDLMTAFQMQANLLLREIESLHKGKTNDDGKSQKILMHCLAGRGRTGTSIAIMNCMLTLLWQIDNLAKDPSELKQILLGEGNIRDHLHISIFSIVRRLREQRGDAVQTDDQYAYIYTFMDEWLKIKEQ